MTRLALTIISLFTAACATGPAPVQMTPRADPAAVAAVESAFARAAREDGTWTAFRRYATGDAVWPMPRLTSVQGDLADQPDPEEPIVWGPDQVWSSCDGSFAVSTGAATHPDGRRSRFVTVWQRQDDGNHRWVLDQAFDLEENYAQPDGVMGEVAACPMARPASGEVRRGEAWGTAQSDDGTLRWETVIAPDCSRVLTVAMSVDGAMRQVARYVAAAPVAPEGSDPEVCD